jgi:hypothetical protein
MAQLPLPKGKHEFYDDSVPPVLHCTASENWVLNNIAKINPCNVATTANLTATYVNGLSGVGATLTNSGTQAVLNIDGLALAIGNRVLVKDQTTNSQNGVYNVTDAGSASTNWVLTRVTELDNYLQFVRGLTVQVFAGTTNSPKIFMLTSSVAVNIGSAAIVFSQLSSSGIGGILGTNNQITVTVVGGVATLSLPTDLILPGTEAVTLPVGTTAQRPLNPRVGMIRFNRSL